MKTRNIILIIVLIFAIIGLVGINTVSKKYDENLTLNIDDSPYTIVVTEGSTVSNVIEKMESDGAIDSAFMTKVFLRYNPQYSTVIADEYTFEKGSTLKDAFELFSVGKPDDYVVFQVLEGYLLEDYANKLANDLGNPDLASQILERWDSPEYVNSLIGTYNIVTNEVLNPDIYHPLEGYLKPDTYHFSIEDFKYENLDFITNFLVSARQNDIENILANGGKYNEHILDSHDAITLASIVEREALTYEDRQIVAGVFMNRLAAGDSLGSDITTYYAEGVGVHERDLTIDELSESNPYNTRGPLYGLPVGPVNNPSMESISAVFNYTPTDYYYFVSDKNGKMYYTSTVSEHEAIVAKLKADGLWYTWD